ncbi:MAG: class I SAM-dependent RNA methyltransferase, partial [Polyangiaceae bacterium]|nr:class I SAM-dependent RNA methyltransferase [Polyangiaceae bacterium]
VPGAVPGDRLRISPEPGSKPPRARLLALLEPSLDRVEAACPLAERCGGCPMMVASPELERATKVAKIEAALHDVPVVPRLAVEWHAAPTMLSYRRRVRLAFAAGRAQALGYRERRSHQLLDVATCPVLVAPLEAALASLRESLLPTLRGEGEIRLAIGDRGLPVATIEARLAQDAEGYRAAQALVDSGLFSGVALSAGGAPTPAIIGDPREVVVAEDGLPMRAGLAGFSQANDAVNAALVAQAVALAEPDGAAVLELYAGAGNLTAPLARRAERVVSIEIAQEAVAASRENLHARQVTAKLVCGKAEDAPSGRFDVVVLDPPRAGAGEAIARILGARPSRIVYVSCDPSTLGRDLRALTTRGYRVDRACAFDMFPRTAHVEALVRLVLA